jgi:hypothetical protein
LGRVEGGAHFGVVVLNVYGSDDAVCSVEVGENSHSGDVVVACVPIAQASDVGFVEGVDELLLKSFVGGIVFAPDTKVFFVLSDDFVDLNGSPSGFNVGCSPGVYGSVENDVG